MIAAGSRLGPYEILGALGSGGMGVVYRARDTRLGRFVAIKVLPAEVSSDPDRLRRFATEAHAVSALNHPNILTVHDVGTHENAPYIVSELLEGETLRRRLSSGRLPLRKALDYATQIATGIGAAHDKGIVHRDLKPENLFITAEGHVKILDFGVARVTRPEGEATDPSELITESVVTKPGSVLGTVGYMSPEQIRGLRTDLRSDVFSFGVVLYELFTGERPFKGSTSVDVMSAILTQDVLDSRDASVPAPLARVIQHCLEKKPEARFQSARDVLFALETAALIPEPHEAASHTRNRWVGPALLAVAALIAGAAAGVIVGRRNTPNPTSIPVFHQLTARRGFIFSARFARDGEAVLYGAAWDGRPVELFTTPSGRPDATSLPIPSADVLSVSPSGELAVSLARHYEAGFATNGMLARVAAGSAPRELLENVQDADWDGEDLIVARRVDGKHRLEWPEGQVVHTTAGWISHPRLSPNRDRVAVFEHPIYGDDRGAVVLIERNGTKQILSDGWASMSGLDWSPSGQEVWFSATREGTRRDLFAVSVSGKLRSLLRIPGSLTLYDVSPDGRVLLTSDSLRSIVAGVAPGEPTERDLSWTDFSLGHDVSADGRIVLLSEGGVGTSSLYATYLRRMDGSPAIRLGDGQPMAMSPDQKWVLTLMLRTPPELVVTPVRAGNSRRLPRGNIEEFNYFATWFPDGKRILFQARERSGHERLYAQSVDGGEPSPVAPEGVHLPIFSDPISPDGRVVAALGQDERLRLYDLNGGNPRLVEGLGVGEAPLLWHHDGGSLYTVERLTPSHVRINRVDLKTQRKALVRDIAPQLAGLMSILHVQAAIDANAYIYSYWQRLSDLYVVEGIR